MRTSKYGGKYFGMIFRKLLSLRDSEFVGVSYAFWKLGWLNKESPIWIIKGFFIPFVTPRATLETRTWDLGPQVIQN